MRDNLSERNTNKQKDRFPRSTSGLPATYGLSPPQTDQQSEAGAAARVWLGRCEVFGPRPRFHVCMHQREREREGERGRERAREETDGRL